MATKELRWAGIVTKKYCSIPPFLNESILYALNTESATVILNPNAPFLIKMTTLALATSSHSQSRNKVPPKVSTYM
jgi:hypothetical protein